MGSLVIAIDGASGVGKSSTSRAVAKRLGLAYLDTGSMYRAIQVAAMRRGVVDDKEALARIVDEVNLQVDTNPDHPGVSIDGVDVTDEIRKPEVSAVVSHAATTQHVRDVLSAQMRRIIEASGACAVVEGRDITTKVWPDAQLRVLLVADPQKRIARRQAQLSSDVDRETVADSIIRRDRDDATMSEFMTAADGVVTIDSSDLTLNEVVAVICGLADEVGRG